jgi:hypothetical protein
MTSSASPVATSSAAAPPTGAPTGRPANDPRAAQQQAAAPPAEDEEEEEYEEESGVSVKMINLMASCGVSLVVHFALILTLGLIALDNTPIRKPPVLEASVPQREIEEVFERLETKIQPATSLNSSAGAASNVQGVQGVVLNPTTAAPKLNTQVTQEVTNVRVDVGAVNVFTTAGTQFVASVPTGTLGEAMATAEGYGDAMEVLTREILNRLARGKVLVVWLFDQSLSMKDDQKEIRDKIELVYQELGLSSAVKDDALWTAVNSYGKGYATHTQRPTNLIEDIKKAIDAVPVDESGEEMMCSAVGQTALSYRGQVGADRQMMIILCTDESGNQNDNQSKLEPAIQVCKDAKASVYCIGREAVFSYPYAHMNWTVTVPTVGGGTTSRHFVLPVDRGPESAFVELLQTEGFRRRSDAHPSGFGPYEQVRMARETGGMFLMLPTPEARVFRRDTTKFDLEYMRPYLPDLRSREQYAQERDYNQMRAIIWKVINDLNPYKPEIAKYIDLRLSFAAQPAERHSQFDVELTKAKMYVQYLDAAEKALKGVAKLRDREKSARWRAHYDLILAQVIAYRARVFEYGVYLQAFKTTPKPFDPPTPTRALAYWGIREQARTLGGSLTQPDIDEATRLFQNIMREYDGTPWATRAKFELARGFGCDLVPHYHNPNPPPPDPNNRPVRPIPTPKI